MDAPPEEAPKPVAEHLEELRLRLIRSLAAVGTGTVLCWNYAGEIFRELTRPVSAALPPGSHLVFTELTEAFLTHFKLALWGGVVLSSPVVLYQAWRFVAPGLYGKERRLIAFFAFWSTLALAAGMGFAHFVAIPRILSFLFSFGPALVIPLPSMKNSLSLVLRLLLIFGVMFELPLVMYLSGRAGILSARSLKKWRKGAILGALLAAAVLTPPDAASQLLVSVPLYALYEAGILLCALGQRRRNRAAPASSS